MFNAHSLNMAGSVRIELDRRDIQGSYFLRVDLAGNIPLNHADGKLFPKPLN